MAPELRAFGCDPDCRHQASITSVHIVVVQGPGVKVMRIMNIIDLATQISRGYASVICIHTSICKEEEEPSVNRHLKIRDYLGTGFRRMACPTSSANWFQSRRITPPACKGIICLKGKSTLTWACILISIAGVPKYGWGCRDGYL